MSLRIHKQWYCQILYILAQLSQPVHSFQKASIFGLICQSLCSILPLSAFFCSIIELRHAQYIDGGLPASFSMTK